MGYFSDLAIEVGFGPAWLVFPATTPRPVEQATTPRPKVTASDLLGFKFNVRVHVAINLRARDLLPAHLRRGPRWMVIGFRYDNPGPGVPVLIRHFATWADADLYADRLIEQDVLQLAYLKEY